MVKKYIFFLFALICTTGLAGCVSETGNTLIGNLLKDPNALETPETPDEPIFNPNTQGLIEHTQNEEIKQRFENR